MEAQVAHEASGVAGRRDACAGMDRAGGRHLDPARAC